MITRENYEEYIVMHVDGELQPAQEEALKNFLDLNPDLKNEMLAYGLTKSTPDNTIIFSGKDGLLKQEATKTITLFPLWAKYGIAAGIAAIFFISMFRFMATNKNEVAKKEQTVLSPANVEKKEQQQQAHPPATVAIAKKDIAAAPVSHYTPGKLVTKKSMQNKRRNSIATEHNTHAVAITTINKIEAATLNQLPGKAETLPPPAIQVPEYTVAVDAGERKTFWDILPIDDLKKKQLNNISAGIKNELDEKTLSVKIEKRKLILSF